MVMEMDTWKFIWFKAANPTDIFEEFVSTEWINNTNVRILQTNDFIQDDSGLIDNAESDNWNPEGKNTS